MIAISRVSVHHDGRGGTASDPLFFGMRGVGLSSVKSTLGLMLTLQRYRSLRLMVGSGLCEFSSLLGTPGALWSLLFVTGADVAALPSSVSLLCQFTSFLGTLHWPAGAGPGALLSLLLGGLDFV